jgi:hypothetical protein
MTLSLIIVMCGVTPRLGRYCGIAFWTMEAGVATLSFENKKTTKR